MTTSWRLNRRDTVMVTVLALLSLGLVFLDLFPQRDAEPGRRERARVLTVDNSSMEELGLLTRGEQQLEVELLSGPRKGERFRAVNQLRAQMELDKVFQPGDTAVVGVLHGADPQTDTLHAQDHYRIGWTLLLFGLFALFLLLFGGITGFNALLSFVFSCLVIWKLVIPLCLAGWNALAVTFLAVALLTAVIIFLVAGLNRKGTSAFAGAMLGVLASSLLAWIFTGLFKINGAVMPYSQALLYSGYEFLSLPDIYIGAIFLSSSGAVMDLAMDVAAGMDEIVRKRPDINRRELLHSGFRMGRAVVGTMTTTLLLAYSGGYLTLLMVFAAQGVPPLAFINNPHVAGEAVKTLVGSFGLVLVAPLTAVISSILLLRRH